MKTLINLVFIIFSIAKYRHAKVKQMVPFLWNYPNINPIDDLLNPQQTATDAAGQAVVALAQAVATCVVNVSCDEAKRRYGQTEIYVDTASKAFSTSVAALNETNNSDLSQNSFPASSVSNAQEATKLAAKQSGLALQATANALASCEVIVNVVCKQCPSGVTGSPTATSRASEIIQEIRKKLNNIF